MGKASLTTIVVLAMVLLTVGLAIVDAYAQIKSLPYSAPLWLVTLCTTALSTIVYATFKAKQ